MTEYPPPGAGPGRGTCCGGNRQADRQKYARPVTQETGYSRARYSTSRGVGLMAWITVRESPDLERRRAACVRRWDLRLGQVLSGGYRSSVCECTIGAGADAVLKLTVTAEEASFEARALECWRGTGAAVRLLEADAEKGAVLLERLRPATSLPGVDERWVLDVVVDLLVRLHAGGGDDRFPDFVELYPYLAENSIDDNRYERATRKEPDRAVVALGLMDEAARAARDLCPTASKKVLLHRDFLDKNLLLNGDRYLAVDPLPRIAEPESEIGFFACEHPPARGIFERAALIAERLDADCDRTLRWTAVWTVLLATSAWRRDQDELDTLVASAEFEDILRG
jgi:streptomycin 6-kinase